MRLIYKLNQFVCLTANSSWLFLALFFLSANAVLAQRNKEPFKQTKPPLDTTTFNKWLWVEDNAAISNDGNYAFYKIREGYYMPAKLIIQAIGGNWKMELQDFGNAVFTEDSRKLVFMKAKDSLSLLTLGGSSIEYIPHVQSFQLFRKGKTEWLACQLNSPDKKLVLRNLETGGEQFFTGVIEYLLSRDGSVLVLNTESGKDTAARQSLRWVNLTTVDSKSSGNDKSIWEGANAGNLVLDVKGDQLAFAVIDKHNDRLEKSFWYYKTGSDKAVQLINDHQLTNNGPAGTDNDLLLERISNFSRDGSNLFIVLKERDVRPPRADAVQVDVWSYRDAKLQSQQLYGLKYDRNTYTTYRAVIHADDRRIIRLQQKDEKVAIMPEKGPDDFVVMDDTKGDREDMNWSIASQPSYSVVNTGNGERQQTGLMVENISPDGKYLIGYKPQNRYTENRALCSHQIATGKICNISESIPVPADIDEVRLFKSKGISLAAWVAGDKPALLVYDKFDIWKVDPTGKKAPINVTNGYGRKNNIVLRLANKNAYAYFDKAIAENERMLLHAFNPGNKNAGFYYAYPGRKGDPEQLSMGPYDYNPSLLGNPPVKARDAEVYLVKRGSATESPNYFWTKDFKIFSPLSEVYPERKYNWLTTKLISFKTIDGRINQAVIYKPENFDPTKKYPVILHYYEQKSDNLNKYLRLFGNDAMDISIDWLVSHGYVVVTPDIYYKMGKNGLSALNAVLGVTNYLSRLPWVDAEHVGLHGESFGGFETNYIVTHTTRFAAAVSSSGICNLINSYGSVWGNGISMQGYYQNRQGRISTTLWETPDIYIGNSPIFRIDKVVTPVLIVANKNDGNVPFGEGLQLFLALRRLGKKAWMLQYDGETHGLTGKAFVDFTMRSQQFFDHYLKGTPAPKWMTHGIPAKMKGIEDGMELDNEVRTLGDGLLIRSKFKGPAL